MTVAMVAAMANLTLDRSVVMTGMVNPDGTVGPVGGIPAKLTAAAAGGARLFLIPAGQEVVIESRIVEEPGPFWITRRVVRERVNVTELGLSLGVSVKPVMTIREAVEAFTGWRIPLEEVEGWVVCLDDLAAVRAIETAWEAVDPCFEREFGYFEELIPAPPEIRRVGVVYTAEEGILSYGVAHVVLEGTVVLLVRGDLAACQGRGADDLRSLGESLTVRWE